jgi:4-amino-4-deoxy-L-arabinose transferase-like glycosyltransferase
MILAKRSSQVMNLLWIVLSLSIAAVALLWKLGGGSLAAWDEAIYAQVSKEIAQSGDWLTLHWQYAPWFEKPPLFMWITAGVYRVLGISEFSARLPSAISGLGLLAVTYVIGRLAFDKRTAVLAAVILFTCYHFLSFSRFGTMEMLLTLLIYVAVYGYLCTKNDQRWWYLAWSACALALMAKGAGGIVAPAAICLAMVFDRRLAVVRSAHFWMACLVAAIIVLPWHVLMFARFGHQFTAEYLGYHVIARATRTLEGNDSSYLYYLGRLIDGFFPMILLAPFAIVSEVRNRKTKSARSWILLTLAGFVFLFYTLIPTRRPWYILPLYPAMAILIAGFIMRFRRAHALRPLSRRTITIVMMLLIFISGFYSFVSLTLNRKPPEPVAKLARLAQSTGPNDRAPLILFTRTKPYYAQVPLFYRNRPVFQMYDEVAPASEDSKRYVNFVRLGDVIDDSEKRIIFREEDSALLSEKNAIRILSQTDGLVYGLIRRRQ